MCLTLRPLDQILDGTLEQYGFSVAYGSDPRRVIVVYIILGLLLASA